MITALYWHEDGHRVAVELDDGDGDLLITDYDYDPPVTESVATLEGDGWTEQAARTFGDS